MKRKRLAGKILSILMAAALTFTSLDMPAVYAAEEAGGYEEASVLEEDSREEEAGASDEEQIPGAEDSDSKESNDDVEEPYGFADIAEDLFQETGAAPEEAEAAAEDLEEDVFENVSGIEYAEAVTQENEGDAGSGEAEEPEDLEDLTDIEEIFEEAAEPEETLSENKPEESASSNIIEEEDEVFVTEEGETAIKTEYYYIYGGKKGTDFKVDENGITVISTTPLVIEGRSKTLAKIPVPIVLGNEASPCDIHVTIRRAKIDVSDKTDVSAIRVPDNYAADVYVVFEDTVSAKGGRNCAGIQKNMTDNSDSKKSKFNANGYLYITANTTLTVTGGDGAAAIGCGVMKLEDKDMPIGGKIVITGDTIKATAGSGSAAIGGGNGASAKNILINGGIITAAGKGGGAAIGGGNNGTGSYIVIKGGKITADGSDKAAGIGGGNNGAGSNITIWGGDITAEGKGGGAGIGGGSGRAGNTISIYGGKIHASGGANAAGIGGGYKGDGNTITIYNAEEIIAAGGKEAAGIGGGNEGRGHMIKIHGGKVNASSTKGGAAIGGGKGKEGYDITIDNGEVNAVVEMEKTTHSAGAGIGGGASGKGYNITIAGGVVNAASDSGAGIGGGKDAAAENIVISEGVVTAEAAGNAAAIGAGGKGKAASGITISGGYVKAMVNSDDHFSVGAGFGGSTSGVYIRGGSANITVDCKVTSDADSQEEVKMVVLDKLTPGDHISLEDITYTQYNASNLLVDAAGCVYIWLPSQAESNASKFTKVYEVKFVTGCYTSEPAQYVAAGKTIKMPEVKNYKTEQQDFGGWYTTPEFVSGTRWKETNTVSGNTVLYAKLVHYNILHYVNPVTGKDYRTEKVYDGALPQRDKDPERSGFEFNGWYLGSKEFDFTKPLTENTTVYASWVRKALVPTTSIPAGEVREGTQILLKSNTVGATIYYTTDGSVPTTKSKVFEDPITLSRETASGNKITIKAFAAREGLANSNVRTYVYTLLDEGKIPGDVSEEDYPAGDITKIPTDNIWIAGMPAEGYTYTGKAIKPVVRIYDGKKLLVEKKDYTVSYKNNVNVPAAGVSDAKRPFITISGKGNYKGKIVKYFTIAPVDISTSSDIFVSDVCVAANGKVQTPVVPVTRNGKKLKNNKDYTVDYSQAGSGIGVYTLTVRGRGNYTGVKETKLQITGDVLLSKVTVGKIQTQAYTGEPVTPEVSVKYKGMYLVPGQHYTVSYVNNISTGTATAVVQGIPNSGYLGTKTVNFKIAGGDMKKVKADCIADKEYIGGGTPTDGYRLYTNDGYILTEGTDFTVSYEKNDKAGKAVIVFTGINKFKGVLKKNFKVEPYNIASDNLKKMSVMVPESAPYVKNGAIVEAVLKFGDKILEEGKDYTLTYKYNTDITNEETANKPIVMITGKGNYAGTVTKEFKVTAGDLSKVTFTVEDIAYTGQPGVHFITAAPKDINGQPLTEGVDFKKTYQYTYYDTVTLGNKEVKEAGSLVESTDIIPAGTEIMVTLFANEKGKYTGNVSAKYRIRKKNIASESGKVNNKAYTGREVMPGKADIFIKNVPNDSYEIVRYENNINKGTGYVIVRGLGANYGGTKKLAFKIEPKVMTWFDPTTSTGAGN